MQIQTLPPPMLQRLLSASFLIGLMLLGSAWAPASAHSLAITDVMLIDVERGRLIGPRTVLIDGARISAIVEPGDAEVAAAADCLDGRGRFLIPGLVDMHVHLFNNHSKRPPNDWALPLFIANGVTAVREMNAQADAILIVNGWREAVQRRELVAPRILALGFPTDPKSGTDAAQQVAAAKSAGADFIKIYSLVSAPYWNEIMLAAQDHSLPVAGHVPARVSLLESATAGQRSNEHLTQAFEACSRTEMHWIRARLPLSAEALTPLWESQEGDLLADFDADRCAQIGQALAVTKQVQVPTLVLAYRDAQSPRKDFASAPQWQYLRADERQRWERVAAAIEGKTDPLAQRRWELSRDIVTIFHRAGVPILSGTDAPMPWVYPGYSLHQELALLVDSGFTPIQALRAATLAPAEFFGQASSSGSMAVGKFADLVLLDADPSEAIANTQRINAVVLNGRLWRRSDLDALLEQAATAQVLGKRY